MYHQLPQKAMKSFPLGITSGIYTRNTGKTNLNIFIYKNFHSCDQSDQIHVLHTKDVIFGYLLLCFPWGAWLVALYMACS